MSTLGVDRLGEVVEQSASEIYVFAADDFRFILVNRGARENLGYSLAELSEMHPWDLKPEFSEEEFKAFVGPLLSAEVPRLSFETVHGRKDGSTYEVSVSLQLIQSQGEFVFFAAIRDISEFNSIRDRLERTSSRLDAILNNTRMAIFMMDEQQNCSFMNRAAEELTGYSFEEAVGRCLHGLIHHQYPDGSPFPIEECPIDRAFPERHQISGEDMFVHKDGNFYNVSYTASPMVDSSGSTVGTIVEAFNIDVVVAARDELAKSHRRLERSVRTFQQAEKIAKLGSWEFDVETQSLTFSDQAYKIMGLDQQRPMTLDDTLEFYSPHERERVEALYLESRRTGKNLDFTAEIVGRGGPKTTGPDNRGVRRECQGRQIRDDRYCPRYYGKAPSDAGPALCGQSRRSDGPAQPQCVRSACSRAPERCRGDQLHLLRDAVRPYRLQVRQRHFRPSDGRQALAANCEAN
jgi:PAS domain S-box-containing protein